LSLQQLILKLLEGITDAAVRADVASVISLFKSLYETGVMSDAKLAQGLRELCLDILIQKHPLKSLDELRDEASKCAEDLYKVIRIETIRTRFFRRESEAE